MGDDEERTLLGKRAGHASERLDRSWCSSAVVSPQGGAGSWPDPYGGTPHSPTANYSPPASTSPSWRPDTPSSRVSIWSRRSSSRRRRCSAATSSPCWCTSLIERAIRAVVAAKKAAEVPLYPEDRGCRAPTTAGWRSSPGSPGITSALAGRPSRCRANPHPPQLRVLRLLRIPPSVYATTP
jgi:hypothetical protein